ncbi:MAG: DUF5329 domain-containing protein [Desulforhopalus sp.]
MIKVTVMVAVLLSLCGFAAGGEEQTFQDEVDQLLSFLENSECEFNRNGTWYDGSKAVDHIKRKYNYLLKKNLVDSTESFIDRAATKSSMSGKAYQVRCGSGQPVESAVWFRAELNKMRANAH